jgi:hypothetical protein
MTPARSPKVSNQSLDLIRQLSERLTTPPRPDYEEVGRRLRELVEEEGEA